MSESDRELADRIVALGVGASDADGEPYYYNVRGYLYNIADDRIWAYGFVRDWRVAGAMMEKCVDQAIVINDHSHATHSTYTCLVHKSLARNESLPRAICEACVEALMRQDSE
jgi:hypothetical protein